MALILELESLLMLLPRPGIACFGSRGELTQGAGFLPDSCLFSIPQPASDNWLYGIVNMDEENYSSDSSSVVSSSLVALGFFGSLAPTALYQVSMISIPPLDFTVPVPSTIMMYGAVLEE